MNIDTSEIDLITDPKERADFITWLRNILYYAERRFGMSASDDPPLEPPTVPAPDPVGDVIILNHKQQQAKAMIQRRSSGWISVSLPSKVDDRHV
jgi:hypothetical protein